MARKKKAPPKKAAKRPAARKSAARKSAARKSAARKSTARRSAARKGATRKSATRKSATAKRATRQPAAKKFSPKSATKARKRVQRVRAVVEEKARQGLDVAREGLERIKQTTVHLVEEVKDRIGHRDETRVRGPEPQVAGMEPGLDTDHMR
jgi:hypothetical protein